MAATVPWAHGTAGAVLISGPVWVFLCARLAMFMVLCPHQSPGNLLQRPFRHLLNDPAISPTITFDHLILLKREAHTHSFTPVREPSGEEGLAPRWAPYLAGGEDQPL